MNRALAEDGLLFAAPDTWPVLCEQRLLVPPRGPGDRGREAQVALRAGRVRLRHPRNGRSEAIRPVWS